MATFKSVLVIQTDESGQPLNLLSLEDGDTISDEVLSPEVRDAASGFAGVAASAGSALSEVTDLSTYVENNQDSWEQGLDDGTRQNLISVSGSVENTSGQGAFLSGVLDTSTNFPNTIVNGTFNAISTLRANLNCGGNSITGVNLVDGVDIAARKLALDTSTNFPNAIVTATFAGNSQLGAALDCNGNDITNPGTVDGVDIAARKQALDTSTNFPNAIVTATFAGNSQLGANLDANSNQIEGLTAVKGTGTNFLTLSGREPLLIGTEDVKIGEGTPGYGDLSSLTTIIHDLASTSATGGGTGNFEGCAIASAVVVGGGSSVVFSGAAGETMDAIPNGAVLALDTDEAKVKFRKIRGTMIDAAADIPGGAIEANTITTSQLATNIDIAPNIAANNIGFNKLTLVGARTITGNANETLNGPMDDLSRDDARNILGLSAGTIAPQYTSLNPSAGDLWYNTDHDELYTYDSGRGHWLGAPYYISFGKANAATASGVGHFLYVGHQGTTATTNDRGWLVPHDMVITGWRGHTQSTFTGWNTRIDKNSGGTNTTGIVQTGVQGAVDSFSDFTLDVDVAAGDILGVACVLGTVTLNNSTVTVKVQRKGA